MVDSKSARARGRRRPSWAVTAAEARSGDYGRGRGCRSSDGMRRHPGVRGFGINHLILVPGSEDLGTALRHRDRELEVRGEGAVCGEDGPVVVAETHVGTPRVDHRLDREDHP